jgi:Mn-dependent DtxR family transcriptional regulator
MMTKQSVGEVVSDLEKRGYVERVPDPEDGRAKLIRLTTKGREVYLTGWQLNDEIEKEWAARIGEDNVPMLRQALELVHATQFRRRIGLAFQPGRNHAAVDFRATISNLHRRGRGGQTDRLSGASLGIV